MICLAEYNLILIYKYYIIFIDIYDTIYFFFKENKSFESNIELKQKYINNISLFAHMFFLKIWKIIQ